MTEKKNKNENIKGKTCFTNWFWKLSSHPEALNWQRKPFLFISFIPVIVLLIVGFVWGTSVDTWVTWAKHPSLVVKITACFIGFSFGAAYTVATLGMVARLCAQRGIKIKGSEYWVFPKWLFAIVILAGTVPQALLWWFQKRVWHAGALNTAGFILGFLCFLPFIAFQIWVCFGGPPPRKKKRRHVFMALGWIVLALAFMSLFDGFYFKLNSIASQFGWADGARVYAVGIVDKYFKGLPALIGAKIAALAILLPLAVVFLSFWRLMCGAIKPDPEENEKRKAPEQEDSAPKMPEWLEKVCNELKAEESAAENSKKEPDVHIVEGSPEHKQFNMPDETSELLDAEDEDRALEFKLLSGGKYPTEAQYNFLERFKKAYNRALGLSLEKSDQDRVPLFGADVLLHGKQGSGKTESLCVAALYAALYRGQNVLFVVRDIKQTQIIQGRLEKRLKELFLNGHVTCEILDSSLVVKWVDDKAAQDGSPVTLPAAPAVLVTTQQALEKNVFCSNSATNASAKALQKLKNVLLQYDVVLVDDFLETTPAERSHLAFLIDKLRLLLNSERILPQFVVTAPLLCKEGVKTVMERLYGDEEYLADNAVMLKPRPLDTWQWELALKVKEAAKLDTVCDKVVKKFSDQMKNVLVYRKGADTKILKDEKKWGDLVRVVSRTDEISADSWAPDVVFYFSLVEGCAASAALRLAVGDMKGKEIVLVRFVVADEWVSEEEAVIPIIPWASAVALKLAHLKSVLPFVGYGRPLDTKTWNIFGISPDTPPNDLRFNLRLSQPKKEYVHCKWQRDEWTDNRYRKGVVWPYMTLSNLNVSTGGDETAKTSVIPVSDEDIFHNATREDNKPAREVMLGRLGRDVQLQTADWVGKRGNHLDDENGEPAVFDLAHADKLRFRGKASDFVPHELRTHNGKTVIEGKRCNGDGMDFDIPIRTMNWQCPEEFASQQPLGNQIVRFRLDNPAYDHATVNSKITGLVNIAGNESVYRGGAEFSYQAYLTGFVLGHSMPKDDNAERKKRIDGLLKRKWDTAENNFSPALTHAFTAVLRRRLDGFTFFASAPVFYLESNTPGAAGAAVMWLLQPINSGDDTHKLLDNMLNDSKNRKKILEGALDLLKKSEKHYQLRQASGLAFQNEKYTDEDRRHAIGVIRYLLENADKDETKPRPVSDDEKDPDVRKFADIIRPVLNDMKPSVDLTDFVKSTGYDFEKLGEIYEHFLYNHPDYFHVRKRNPKIVWNKIWQTGEITKCWIELNYYESKTQYEANLVKLNAKVDEIVAVARENMKAQNLDDGDQAVLALHLHDALVRICDYDTSGMNEGSPRTRSACVLLTKGAVCEGYATAYVKLCRSAELECREMLSNAMLHVWNYVKINGTWFNIDATWNDPLCHEGKPIGGDVSRKYFMLSDKAMSSHYGRMHNYGCGVANDPHFDNRDWKTHETPWFRD